MLILTKEKPIVYFLVWIISRRKFSLSETKFDKDNCTDEIDLCPMHIKLNSRCSTLPCHRDARLVLGALPPETQSCPLVQNIWTDPNMRNLSTMGSHQPTNPPAIMWFSRGNTRSGVSKYVYSTKLLRFSMCLYLNRALIWVARAWSWV